MKVASICLNTTNQNTNGCWTSTSVTIRHNKYHKHHSTFSLPSLARWPYQLRSQAQSVQSHQQGFHPNLKQARKLTKSTATKTPLAIRHNKVSVSLWLKRSPSSIPNSLVSGKEQDQFFNFFVLLSQIHWLLTYPVQHKLHPMPEEAPVSAEAGQTNHQASSVPASLMPG